MERDSVGRPPPLGVEEGEVVVRNVGGLGSGGLTVAAGASAWVGKPIDPKQLLSTVNAVMAAQIP